MDVVRKRPGARLHYGFDWNSGPRPWLALLGSDVTLIEDGDEGPLWTITERSGAETGDDVALTSEEELIEDGSQTWIQLAGGTDGLDYKVKASVTASDGSKDERTLLVRVRE